jgi:hypothetical protein
MQRFYHVFNRDTIKVKIVFNTTYNNNHGFFIRKRKV